MQIAPIDDRNAEQAAALLHRFFLEEGFEGGAATIAANLDRLRRDPHHWAAGASEGNAMLGVITVTSMLYVEWGRLGEIGDLYVLPEARGGTADRAALHSPETPAKAAVRPHCRSQPALGFQPSLTSKHQ